MEPCILASTSPASPQHLPSKRKQNLGEQSGHFLRGHHSSNPRSRTDQQRLRSSCSTQISTQQTRVLMRPPSNSNSTSDSIQCWVEPAADESPGSKGSKRDRHQRRREATKVETKSFTDYGLLALFVAAFAPILVNRMLYDVYFLYLRLNLMAQGYLKD